jgi:salicylate hydroxylase
MATSAADPLRIAIVGGGIGGLATAAFLRRAGFDCTVYEQASRLTEIGAGLVVAPNAARLLRRLGVLEDFATGAVRLDVGWEFRRWEDGRVLSAEDLSAACQRLYGEHTYTAHRADLFDVIRAVVPADSVHLGQRCLEVDTSGQRPMLRLASGETVGADLVVGADGMHSVVRGLVTESPAATASGLCAFRSLVPAAQAPEFSRRPAQTLWIGPGHHLVHYPVSAGRFVNLVAFAPAQDEAVESWSATATVEEFLAEFEGWDARLVDLIRAAGTVGRWALFDRAPLPRWSRGTVTLLGDAAHPMFPFFAQGAAQAIEDAAMLAGCLAEGRDDPVAALQRYETLRRPRTSQIQELSHGRSLINHLPDGLEQQQRDLSFASADPLVANGWIYGYDPEAELGGPMQA